MKTIRFTKMHGCANDYVYLDCRDGLPQDIPALARRLSDRHTGIGGDGIVLICRSECADFRMRMFNADGSEGAMCGNAIRCVAKYVYDRKLTDKTLLAVETASGVKTLRLFTDSGVVTAVTVDMGAPVIRAVSAALESDGVSYVYSDISMGNPHCVVFVEEDVTMMDIRTPGSRIENMRSLFPDRTNVEFAQIVGDNLLRVRVWERGSGETMACGTGACAAAVAAIERGFCDGSRPVTIRMNGGDLQIEVTDTVLMTGPCAFVFDGEIGT